MKKRVVITGMGVAAPNAHGLDNFEQALKEGRSGIRFIPQLEAIEVRLSDCRYSGRF
jgi:3-oxoacyl-[acyl-carrier-protein] synthase-1